MKHFVLDFMFKIYAFIITYKLLQNALLLQSIQNYSNEPWLVKDQ